MIGSNNSGPVEFISVPISELTTNLKDFQGRAEAYSTDTYNRIVDEVANGAFNFSALPAIQIWKDPTTNKWVILGGHSRTAAFTDLAKAKYPINEKYKASDFDHIHAQIVRANSLEEAKKVAQESNVAGVQSDIDFANYARSIRPTFRNKSEYLEKLNSLFRGNSIWINELSQLNPNGKTMNMLQQFRGTSDKAQRAEIDKIASYIGAIREKFPQITNAHEDEIYDWLKSIMNLPKDKVAAHDKISSKSKVLNEIASRLSRLDFNPEEPLNLMNIGTKTYIAQGHDERKLLKEAEIREKQKEYNALRDRYLADKVPTDKIEELLAPMDKYIIRLQRDLMELMQKDAQVNQAEKSILGLFDSPPPPPSPPADQKILNEKLQNLLSLIKQDAPEITPVLPAKELPLNNVEELIKTMPPMYGASPFMDGRVLKYQVDIPTMKIVAYDYPLGKFEEPVKKFYETYANKFSITPPDGYKPFRSEILNADYFGARIYGYQMFPPFLLDQLDWWLSEFEGRYLTKKIPITARWNFVPQNIGQQYGYNDVEMLKQVLETAIHIFADELIRIGIDDKQTYNSILDFYNHQPTIKWRSSNSLLLQQYSTPIPIAYLISKYCIPVPKFGDRYLEPSAGTGLLTIGTPPGMWTVNEFDKDRLLCLKFLGFKDTHNLNSNQPLPFEKIYDAIITNPPFGTDIPQGFDGYKIKKLEHRMAAFALRKLKDSGRSAIIIGGGGYDISKLYDQESGLMMPYGTDRVFFSWLYKFYNVVDIIHVNGFLYSRMGAAAPIRIILIDGESTLTSQPHPYYLQEIKDLPPEKRNSPTQIRDYGVLLQRFSNE